MSDVFPGWLWMVEEVDMLHSYEETREWQRPIYMDGRAGQTPTLTPDEEYERIQKQVEESEGFDIEFEKFHCLFTYHPVTLDHDDFADKPEKNVDLLNRFCQKSLDNYNQDPENEKEPTYEFDKVLYSTFHGCPGIMFMITFQVKDPSNNLTKLFQAKVYYSFFGKVNYVFCRPRPDPNNKEASSSEQDLTDEDPENDAKKPKLE